MGWYSPGAEQVGDEGMPRKTNKGTKKGTNPGIEPDLGVEPTTFEIGIY